MVRLALIAVLLLGGCAVNRQYFRPTERQRGETVNGYPEALYTLVGPRGQFGEAKVWSRGAYRGPNGETIIDVTLEIHDTSGEPIDVRASELRLQAVRVRETTLRPLSPRERTDAVVAPGANKELVYHFELPREIAPGDVNALLFRWSVHNAGQSYSQRTPFVAHYRRSPYGYAYPYYYCDPYDPLCFNLYGYYSPFGPPYYGPGIVHVPPPRPVIIVRPRR